MLHTFLRYCSYTEQWRRPLRLQAHSSSVDQEHSIAMERQACPSISSAMVHCKGIEHHPYFNDRSDTFIFFFTPSPQSPFYFFCLTDVPFHPTKGVSAQIYMYLHIYIYRERETDQNNKHFIIHYLVFYKHSFFTQECHQRLFFQLCIVCQLYSGTFFFLCFGVGVILVLT